MTDKNRAEEESRENKSFESVQSAIRAVLDTVTASARTFLLLLFRPHSTMHSLCEGGRQYVPPLAFLAVAAFIFLIFAEAIAENIDKSSIGPDVFVRGLLTLRDSSAFGLVLRALPVLLASVAWAALARRALARPGGQERMGRALHYAAGLQLLTISLLTLLLSGYGLIRDEYGTEGGGPINRLNRFLDNLLFERGGLGFMCLLASTLLAPPTAALWRAVRPDLLRRMPRNRTGRLVALLAACLLSFALALSAALVPLLIGRRLAGDTTARINFATQQIGAEEFTSHVPQAVIEWDERGGEIVVTASIRNNTGATLYLARAHPELQWRETEDAGQFTTLPLRIAKWSDGDSPVLAVRPGEVKWLTARTSRRDRGLIDWLKRSAAPRSKLFRLRLFEFYYDPEEAGVEPPSLLSDWMPLRFADGPAEAASPPPSKTPEARRGAPSRR